jgi:uncharacterized protein (TIGR02231 family)
VESRVDSVVLYGVGADVRRTAKVVLEPGVHELLFSGIPSTEYEPLDGLRASASGAWKILGVDVRRWGAVSDEDSEIRMLQDAIREARKRRDTLQMRSEGIRMDLEFLRAIGMKVADAGTERVDLDIIQQQLAFVREERTRLQDNLVEELERLAVADRELDEAVLVLERRGPEEGEEMVRVRVEVPEAGEGEVSIRYLCARASWEPSYSIYSVMNASAMPIDYEAVVIQATGEDWNDVEMTLSTATPSMPSGPPIIQSVYVDRRPDSPEADRSLGSDRNQAVVFGSKGASPMEMIRNAAVTFGGSAVTYKLPGRVSVSTDEQGSTRMRIADLVAPAKRVLVARPVVDQKVYLRADLVNNSSYVLLGGEAALFMEGEYVGPNRLEAVPAGADFEIWFGPDPSITIDRAVVGRTTDRTGLLGGGRQTSIEYRIEIVNEGTEAATVEIWDRRPVSRDGDIEVRVVDVSPELARDEAFQEIAARQGLLKWQVDLQPAGNEGSRRTITWKVRVNRSSDMEITPIPE